MPTNAPKMFTASLLLAGVFASCGSPKAQVDAAFSQVQREAAAGVDDLNAAEATGEVGPTAAPFRRFSTPEICAHSVIVGQGPGGVGVDARSGVAGMVGVDAGSVGVGDRPRDLPLVANGATGADPGRADASGADLNPGIDAERSEPRGAGAGPEPARVDAGVDRGTEGDGPGLRRRLEDRIEALEEQADHHRRAGLGCLVCVWFVIFVLIFTKQDKVTK